MASATLFPSRSAATTAATLPAFVPPMLCTLIKEPFDHPDWIFEPKFDGLRLLARFDGRRVELLSRNQLSQNVAFPDIVAALEASLKRPMMLDGEVVCFDEQGKTSFRALQQRFHLQDVAEARARARQYPAFVYLFDLLYREGRDLMPLPLEERKQLLKASVRWSERVRWTEFQETDGKALLHQACREGQEGIIGKQRHSPYVPGRSDWWVKLKCLGRQEFVIGGYTEPQRSRVGLGALLVGYYADGQQLRYAGKVGTGYTRETLLDLRQRLEKLEQRLCPFADKPATGAGTHWVKPALVAEIAYGEWTQHERLRQPRFEGLRPDKRPQDCRREQAVSTAPVLAETVAPPSEGEQTMPLETYNAKRDFTKTAEPAGAVGKPHHQPIFVVQEHHASRLHYDFRLEADGVLKSWAVPKEPSMNPADKRLAVQVEDHPLSYANFAGTIPEGQYGAGIVHIWDHGTYDNLLAEKAHAQTVTEGIRAGRLEFALHGDKLQGKYALIRMQGRQRGKDNWLLIKMKDAYARPSATKGHAKPPARRAATVRRTAAAPTKRRASTAPSEPEFTHTDKILFPDAGITKGQVLDYYRKVAPRLLPFLRDRPITLERLPEGLGEGKPRFWQKNTPAHYPEWLPRIDLPSERGKSVNYVLVNDLPSLLYLVNQGALTLHIGFSRTQILEHPDFVLFDLDPGQATFSDVVAVARTLHEQLQEQGHDAYVKTSGKTGLHVLVPWGTDGDFDAARAWATEIAESVAAALPEQATVDRSKAKRHRRVYVDVLQNALGHHAVPPYVLRAVPEATVSMPLAWRELTATLDPKHFTMDTALRRWARQKEDPLAALVKHFTHS